MDSTGIFAKATIAVALIGAHAVEIPNIPRGGAGTPDAAGIRLRELSEYVLPNDHDEQP